MMTWLIRAGLETPARNAILAIARAAIVLIPSFDTVSPLSAQEQSASPTVAGDKDVPVLAYYYIWFDESSWNRAKTDYPLLGRYTSDDPTILKQHVRWAKAAGIDGFIVSWKNANRLSPRLKRLAEIARDEDFKLVIIYQGLDFERDPLSIDQIGDDLDYFAENYASDEVFNVFGKPAIIWSGTWEFSREEIAEVTSTRRDDLLILASEKNVDGYLRLADIVDGNAYYWSSVNPETQPGYGEKLQEMANAIHSYNGIWVAPAAPGFDARLIGGSRVVERDEGETLRLQFTTAMTSSPDALGIISWNEFSENSHIEPSCEHSNHYLVVIADLLGGSAPVNVGPCREATPGPSPVSESQSPGTAILNDQEASDFDSSSPGGTTGFGVLRAIMLGGLMVAVGMSIAIVARRARSNDTLRLAGGGK